MYMLIYIHMNRTTILLPATLRSKAAGVAKKKGISLSELIRRGLEAAVARDRGADDPLFADGAVFTGDAPADASTRHDADLYGDAG